MRASRGTFSEVENLTVISNFWALTARSLIGKSWKIVDIARLWPGLSRRRPLTANDCEKMCDAADTLGTLPGTTVGLRSQPVAKWDGDSVRACRLQVARRARKGRRRMVNPSELTVMPSS
jgi:hypothetical protein